MHNPNAQMMAISADFQRLIFKLNDLDELTLLVDDSTQDQAGMQDLMYLQGTCAHSRLTHELRMPRFIP